jgi:uncharacterized protein DUF4382
MKTVTKWLAAGSVIAAAVFFFACNKNNSSGSNPNVPPGKSQLSIYMMDGPILFSKVLIDISQVVVEIDTAAQQTFPDVPGQWDNDYCGWQRTSKNRSVIWDTLNITPGVYNLMDLRNGTDTLLATGDYPTGKVLKVKITLGSNNTIYTDSTTYYPLEVFGPNPYFIINVGRQNVDVVDNNDFKLWLDFNLSRSVFFWDGTFLLSPYVVAFNDVTYSKLQGQVLPYGVSPLVTAISGADTLYAIPNWNGTYQIRGVPTGTYSINFKGNDGYQDTTISNIVVDSMKVVQVPTITLHK